MITKKRNVVKGTLYPKGKGSSGKFRFIRHLSFLLLCFSFCCLEIAEAKKNKDFSVTEVTQQKVKVSGVILDEGGDVLPGATVQIQGTTQGVIADMDGRFTDFEVPVTCKLMVSYLGMITKTVNYNGEKELTVTLESNTKELEEVAVVAFSKQKKESVLASISTVKPSELRVPSSNLTTAFAGRVAGLISYQQSGEPGLDNASYFIRGITSFGADSKKDPLILIDGVELGSEDLSRMNTDDIASFSIMKDATATALYGARGANGVIMVTTKEGREGKIAVNARLETSFSSATKMIETADPVTFMKMHNESVKTRDPLGLNIYSSEKIYMTEHGLYPDIFPTTDWYDLMFKDVTNNYRANISLSGGGTVARYYVAVNYTQDNGNLTVDKRNNFNSNINLKKISVRSNINLKLTSTTELVTRLSANFDDYRGPIEGGAGMYRKVIRANPVMFKPYYEPDEMYSYAKHILFGNFGSALYVNPYADALRGYRDESKNTMLVQFEGKQDLAMILEGLKARVMFNIDRFSEYKVDREYFPFYYDIESYNLSKNSYKLRRLNPTSGTEYLTYFPHGRNIDTKYYLEATMEYNNLLADKHGLNVLLVYTMSTKNKAMADDLQLSLPNRNIGLAGRLAYNYDLRYFGEFNFGYNGSERFAENNRWGFFPSIGVAWLVSNEAFFEPLKNKVEAFKLKATYGLNGLDQIGSDADRFYYLSNVTLNASRPVNWGTNMNESPGGVDVSRYANFSIGWEKSYKLNGGIELTLNNGLSTIVDVFRERRENILVDRVIPNTMGIIPAVKANLGKAEGKGIDIELNYEKSFNKDFWVMARGTFTYAKSKVLEWEEPDYTATPWLSRVGYSVNQKWGLIAERLFIDDEEVRNSPTQFGTYSAGDIKYRDVNGDGVITEMDAVPIGHPDVPEINYGFGPSIGYKNLDFSFFFTGSGRQSFWFDLSKITPFMNGDYGSEADGRLGQTAIVKAFADSYWSESNRDPYAMWPRLSNSYVVNNMTRNTWFMQDATFLRLKNMEIGYTLPVDLQKRFNLVNLRIYLSGTNLMCFSRFKLWDPEMAGNGLGYPVQRVFNVGINIGL
ncbi:MAG: TonB-dependent receptor [Tannerella sp.]|jgi:TonB-linked SusC/RagA family outer membrane protein|nr:TonB-dependent receptor [Tannerella sp.]